jgi:hypothetical protein
VPERVTRMRQARAPLLSCLAWGLCIFAAAWITWQTLIHALLVADLLTLQTWYLLWFLGHLVTLLAGAVMAALLHGRRPVAARPRRQPIPRR